MAGLVRFPSTSCTPAAAGRLRFALAVSALAHWALLATPLVDTRRPGATAYTMDAPIAVRFVPPAAARDAPEATEAKKSRVPVRPWPAAGSSMRARSDLPATVAAPPHAEAPVALRAPDPTYYPARELDAYPQPAQPLELDRLSGAGRFRLLLLIDEHGIVNDVSLVEAGAAVRLDEALRAALAATRFLPAQKDGRAVRSRIVLSISIASER